MIHRIHLPRSGSRQHVLHPGATFTGRLLAAVSSRDNRYRLGRIRWHVLSVYQDRASALWLHIALQVQRRDEDCWDWVHPCSSVADVRNTLLWHSPVRGVHLWPDTEPDWQRKNRELREDMTDRYKAACARLLARLSAPSTVSLVPSGSGPVAPSP